jgi:hypothetical protein
VFVSLLRLPITGQMAGIAIEARRIAANIAKLPELKIDRNTVRREAPAWVRETKWTKSKRKSGSVGFWRDYFYDWQELPFYTLR